jgi:uncharacterized protein (TIGR02588 family)
MLEKIATAISGIIVLTLLSILVWDAIHTNVPATFAVEVAAPTVVNDAYRAEVTVHNRGDDGAKDVVVHLELAGRDSTLAETDLTVDWLPARSRHRLVGIFPRPRGVAAGDIRGVRAEVHGYSSP